MLLSLVMADDDGCFGVSLAALANKSGGRTAGDAGRIEAGRRHGGGGAATTVYVSPRCSLSHPESP